MVNIHELRPLIVEGLRPLAPDKIIPFGSFAYGTPHEDSDIDLFLLKDDLKIEETRYYEIDAYRALKALVKRFKIGFDILSAPTDLVKNRDDYFYKVDILKNGIVLYE